MSASANVLAFDDLYGKQLLCKVNKGITWITLSFEYSNLDQVLMRKRDIIEGGSFLNKGLIYSYKTNTREVIVENIKYLFRNRIIRRDTLETFVRWDKLMEEIPRNLINSDDNGKCILWKGPKGNFNYFHRDVDKRFQNEVRKLKSGNQLQ